jgi:hypothetical protein
MSRKIIIRIHRIISWPVVLYGSETWYPMLRKEHILRAFENRMLRTFEPKMDEVTRGW